MTDGKTRLQFEATLGGVQVKQSKSDGYSAGPKGAELVLSLSVKQPSPPREPFKSYFLEKPRPELPKQKKGEEDAEYEGRCSAIRSEQERWDAELVVYQQKLAAYHADVEALRDRTLAFAQLVGISAVFGNQPVTVTIEPAGQELLPGFEVSLLAPPEPKAETTAAERVAAASFPEADDPDWDDEEAEE